MDEQRQGYIARRDEIRRTRRRKPQKKEGFFILKLNMALAIGIIVLCANMIDLDITSAFSEKIEYILGHSADLEELKTAAGNIFAFAKEDRPIEMDEELIDEMNEQASAYENAQKKTP